MGNPDWFKAVDPPLALKNVMSEYHGDWHKDPWQWPEYDYILKHAPEILVDWLNGDGCTEVSPILVPKENWGTRPAVVLDLVDRLGYQALIDKNSVKLIGDMAPNVFGWRLIPGEPEPGIYAHDNIQWENYRGHLASAASNFESALRTDIVSCFASMHSDMVMDEAFSRASNSTLIKRVESFLAGFGKLATRGGLPQRARPSSVLANMVMRHFDDVLEGYASPIPDHRLQLLGEHRKNPRTSFVRWMDDIWLFGNDPGQIRRAQLDLQSTADSLGLHLNSSKTDLLEGEDVFKVAMEVELSAVDDGLLKNDPTPLEQLIELVLASPGTAGRTRVKFMTVRMANHNVSIRTRDFLDLAVQMPHCSDALARYFTKRFQTPELQEWFLDSVRGSWNHLQWPQAQYLGMFPSSPPASQDIQAYAAERIDDPRTELPLLAVCAQRLAEWNPGSARAVISEAVGSRTNPNERRVLSLAALQAGDSASRVRSWLKQHDANRPTLAMLEHGHFKAPKVSSAYMTRGPA